MKKLNYIVNKIKMMGAGDVVIISADNIVFNDKLKGLCEKNICGRYGKCYNCPPYIGTTKVLKEQIKKYKYALIFETTDCIRGFADVKSIEKAEYRMYKLTQNVDDYLKSRFLDYKIITASCCKNCNPCQKVYGKECINKDKVYFPLAAYGIDMERMAELYDMYISWEGKTVSYFSIVLLK